MTLDPPISDAELMRIAQERVSQRIAEKAQRRERRAEKMAGPATKIHVVARAALPDRYLGMNKWERRRAQELDLLKKAGKIANWWGGKMSGITLQLGFDVRYTPDFMIQDVDGCLRLEEVKGFWRDDAKAKTRICASLYPFPLSVMVLTKEGWDVTHVKGTAVAEDDE